MHDDDDEKTRIIIIMRRRRRREMGSWVHDIWTRGGSDPSGLAPPLCDGRIEALSWLVMGEEEPQQHPHHNDDDSSPTIRSIHQPDDDVVTTNVIDRVHFGEDNLSYADFSERYMQANRPVVIQGLMRMMTTTNSNKNSCWKSRLWWLKRDHDSDQLVPDTGFLKREFGSEVVPVARQAQSGFSANRPVPSEMTVADYMDWWDSFHAIKKKEQDVVVEQDTGDTPSETTTTTTPEPLLYLKDWKFVASHPTYDAYEWPIYFRDDWLNQAVGNAYKFVYLGPQGTSTVLHADVLRSFSWSTNVCGRKRWYLVPPEKTYLLYDCFGKTLATHLHADLWDGQGTFYPGLKMARQHAICVDQLAGETIFVPSCWHHTVENLEPTLSINHNWLNACNIHHSWEKLESEVRSLRQVVSQESAADASETAMEPTDNSQVDDDLLLLWQILSGKYRSIADQLCTATGFEEKSNVETDLKAIQRVVHGLDRLVNEGSAPSLQHRGDCDVTGLRKMVDEMLEQVT